jgi:phage tail protein X
MLVNTLWSLLFGLEAAFIRVDALERRGYAHVASVVADDVADAEIKYLHGVANAAPRLRPPPLPTSVPVVATPPVIGVFPVRGDAT